MKTSRKAAHLLAGSLMTAVAIISGAGAASAAQAPPGCPTGARGTAGACYILVAKGPAGDAASVGYTTDEQTTAGYELEGVQITSYQLGVLD